MPGWWGRTGDVSSQYGEKTSNYVVITKNKATARLATRGNSWIFHDASFTKSWHLQGFVKTWQKRQVVVTLGPTNRSAFRVERSSIFNTSEKNYCFFCWTDSVTSDHQSFSKTHFSTHPCKLFSVDSSWPAFPVPSTGYDLSCVCTWRL